jgi:Alpha-L-arabinofuranosidase C-terminal domain
MRAADGHPQPFDLLGVEVGNEDFFDSSGSYNAYRYPMFYDAIKAASPGCPGRHHTGDEPADGHARRALLQQRSAVLRLECPPVRQCQPERAEGDRGRVRHDAGAADWDAGGFQVASQSPGHTYLVVVNDGGAAAPMKVALSGLPGGARGGSATTLTGDPAAMNSLAHPTAIAPAATTLSVRGSASAIRSRRTR